jgi:poly(3-hydroxybutyrate) depolymerase
MAAIMAVTYPDLYAAAGIHSGLPYGAARDLPTAFAAMRDGAGPGARRAAQALTDAGTPGRIVPTIIFHGDGDTTVNRANADRIVNQWVVVSYVGAAHRAAHPSDAWSEKRQDGQVPGGYAYTRFIYRDPSGSPVIEKWIVRGLGHAWSGGSPAGSFTDAQGPDASAEMLRFFSQHRLQQ